MSSPGDLLVNIAFVLPSHRQRRRRADKVGPIDAILLTNIMDRLSPHAMQRGEMDQVCPVVSTFLFALITSVLISRY